MRRATNWLQKRFASRGLILMYHRVAEKDIDPWSLCVTSQHFSEHLEVLQKHARPISLRQLAEAYQEGNIPNRTVVVTFDDGYANNLHNAKPLLERFNIPATVFVTTAYIDKNREFWWDELDYVMLQPGRLPEKLCLTINGSLRQWDLGAAVNYREEDYRHDRNRQDGKGQPGSRLSLYYSIYQQLQRLSEERQQKAMDEILIWADAEPVARSTHRSLVPEEICILGQRGLVEIGAHTANHPLLCTQSIALQRNEIQKSRADLEEIMGHRVTSFSYPFGNYTEETIHLVQEAEFTCACSAVEETVWRHSDCFQLPRFEVQNWNGEEFERKLLRWFRFR